MESLQTGMWYPILAPWSRMIRHSQHLELASFQRSEQPVQDEKNKQLFLDTLFHPCKKRLRLKSYKLYEKLGTDLLKVRHARLDLNEKYICE